MPFEEVELEALYGPLNETEKKNAPATLFVAGDKELLRRGRRVSVVGTRKPSEEGRKRAERFTRFLVEEGITVVSGLAQGIDTVAHWTAIESGGRTIAVLGTPLDKCYPAKNRELLERIMREHLAVSQFPPGSSGGRRCFPMRSRTMALLSDATVIIEAGDGSGTLHQGWEALRLGRLLFLAESLTKDPSVKWPAEMIHYGAQVLSDTKHFLDLLPEIGRNEVADLDF